MVWKAKTTRPVYAERTLRERRKFAWIPAYIDGDIVWLETYKILQMFVIKYYNISENQAAQVTEWVDISKSLIK